MMSTPSLEEFMQEVARYNAKNYEPPASTAVGDLLDAAATASILFFSDGSAEFHDKKGNFVKGHSLDEIYTWLTENNC